jgi:Uma2 family endonuclease
MYDMKPPKPSRERLPTMYDLPSEDPEEPGLPDEYHPAQAQFLRDTFRSKVVPPTSTFIGTDLNVYFDSRRTSWYKRPDWFLVLGAAQSETIEEMRWSYVIWQENVSPFLVVELLSPGTEDEDLGQTLRVVGKPPTKWEVYERILHIPYYVVFERAAKQLRAFKLNGSRYEELVLVDSKIWLEEVELGLGVWEGRYQGTHGKWLRWYEASGHWVLTPLEISVQSQARAEQEQARAEQEQARAEQEQARAEQEQARAEQAESELEAERSRSERLMEQLRALGIEPE